MFRASNIFGRTAGSDAPRPAQAKAGATQKRVLSSGAVPHVRQWDPATGQFVEEDIPAEVKEMMGMNAKKVKLEATQPAHPPPQAQQPAARGPAPPVDAPPSLASPLAASAPKKRAPSGLMVQLSGFSKPELNTRYAEKPDEEIQGKASYWDPSLQYFIYWQSSHRRWAISDSASVHQAKSGLAPGWAFKQDVKHFAKGGNWMESSGREWVPVTASCAVLQGSIQEQPSVIKAELADGTETELSAEQYQDLVRRVYEQKNPAKMPEVDGFLEKYAGREDELFTLVCGKYQVDRQELLAEQARVAAAAAVEGAAADEQIAEGEDVSMAEVPELSAREYATLVQSVYEQYNPKKLSDMGRLLQRYRHRMRELYYEVCKKYQVDPAKFRAGLANREDEQEGEPGVAEPV